MKQILIALLILTSINLQAQVTIETNNRGGTRSITRPVQEAQKIKLKEVNVLFIGNEMSAANRMHQVFQYIGAQLPIPYKILAANLFAKGFSFEEHNERTDLNPVYEKYAWDYAIIQGNYKKALGSSEKYKSQAISLIKNLQERKTKVIILMPWAENYSIEDSKTLFSLHQNLARETSSLLAPVGTAFIIAKKHEPKIKLFLEDGIHPSAHGSYLTAAVLVSTLTRQNSIGQKQLGLKSISKAEGLYLQKVASKVIKDYAGYLKRHKN